MVSGFNELFVSCFRLTLLEINFTIAEAAQKHYPASWDYPGVILYSFESQLDRRVDTKLKPLETRTWTELNWKAKDIEIFGQNETRQRGSRATATATVKRSYNMRKRRRHNKNKKQASTKQNKIKQSIAYQANNNNSSNDDADDDDDDVVAGLLLRLGTGDNLLLLLLLLQHIRNAFGPFFSGKWQLGLTFVFIGHRTRFLTLFLAATRMQHVLCMWLLYFIYLY